MPTSCFGGAALHGILANDTDAEGDPLTATLSAAPVHGQVVLNANGSFSYTPVPGFVGSDSFTYRAFDGQRVSGIATISILVAAQNQAPTARTDLASTDQNTAVSINVLANDSDGDGDQLTAVLLGGVSNGTLKFTGNGVFLYTPAAGFSGRDSFVYKASDGKNMSNIALASFIVIATNQPPVTTLSRSSATLAENTNTTNATSLASITVNDDALGTNVLWLSGTDSDSFEIVGNELRFRAGVMLDFETKPSYSVRVNVDDASVGGTPDAFADFTLAITDINESPTSVALSPSSASLLENANTANAMSLASITMNDNALGKNVLWLSGTDADSFEIVGNALGLRAGVILDFETQPSYSVRVNVDDSSVGGKPDAFADFTLNITDVADAPSLTSVVINGGVVQVENSTKHEQ